MLIALYIGGHANDRLSVRLGRWLTLVTQKGGSRVTHAEAIVQEHADGAVDLASATLRKEAPGGKTGVRIKKHVRLQPGNWRIVDVPQINAAAVQWWFILHEGDGYDARGAFASVLPIWWSSKGKFFCYQAVCTSAGIAHGESFTGPSFEAMVLRFGQDVTDSFFSSRS